MAAIAQVYIFGYKILTVVVTYLSFRLITSVNWVNFLIIPDLILTDDKNIIQI